MNRRIVLIALAWMFCLGTVSAVWFQHNQLGDLRARRQLGGGVTTPSRRALTNPDDGTQSSNSNTLSDDESREMLRLRAEVTRLTARKRELAGVSEVSEQLHAQFNGSPTNTGGVPLPPGYIRKANAVFLGYATPEATLQSWLWALQHHDVEKWFRVFTPERASSQGDPEAVFKRAESMPGLSIVGRQDLSEREAELQIWIGPNMPPGKIHFQLLDGEWKMEER